MRWLIFHLLPSTDTSQYTPERDPGLADLFADGKDFLLRVERDFGSMGRWVGVRSAKREDIYTQYHATYCAVVGLADANFTQVKFQPSQVYGICFHLKWFQFCVV